MMSDQALSANYVYGDAVRNVPVLELKEFVVLPLGSDPQTGLRAGRKRSVEAVRWALDHNDGKALLLTQRSIAANPTADDFYDVGVYSILTDPNDIDGEIQFAPIAESRAVVMRLDDSERLLTADIRLVMDAPIPSSDRKEVGQLAQNLLKAFKRYCEKTNRELGYEDQSLLSEASGAKNPGRLADLVAFYCYYKLKESQNPRLSHQQVQRVLETLDPRERLETALELLKELLDLAGIEDRITARVREQLEKTQREYYLREKIKAIQKELGRDSGDIDRNLTEYLGPPRFLTKQRKRVPRVGAAYRLAYTQVGGDVIQIQAKSRSDGKGGLTFTGNLGMVMKESAEVALHFIGFSDPKQYDLDAIDFKQLDMCVHVPEGAAPKEGPAAGIAFATAMLSTLTGRKVRCDVAMTGEITLFGDVLPVGGLKEKLLAARRAGIKTVLIPKENVKDLHDIPEEIREGMEIVPVATFDEVVEKALLPKEPGEKPEEEGGVDVPTASPS